MSKIFFSAAINSVCASILNGILAILLGALSGLHNENNSRKGNLADLLIFLLAWLPRKPGNISEKARASIETRDACPVSIAWTRIS